MAFSFLHAADLHIDSPMRGLRAYEGAPEVRLRGATRLATEALVEAAIEHGVGFVLLAGDIFDGDWDSFDTGLFFVSQMARLREAGIPVYSVRGNHDAASKMSRRLRLPANIESFEQPAGRVQLAYHPDLPVVVHGFSYPRREVTDDVTESFDPCLPDLFNIGLLHTSLAGDPNHDTYAPCSPATLRSKGYQYWALGHVHTRSVIEGGGCQIVFPGNTQGRHVREPGPRGCSLVTVADDLTIASHEFLPLDSVRWATVEVDASPCDGLADVWAAAGDAVAEAVAEAEGRLLAARLRITGSSAAHHELIRDPDAAEANLRAEMLNVFGDGVFVEKVRLETRRAASLEDASEAQRDLVKTMSDPEVVAAAVARVAADVRALGNRVRVGGGPAINLPTLTADGSDARRDGGTDDGPDVLEQARQLAIGAVLETGSDQ